MSRTRVLLTGHRGYIGSVLVSALVDRGYDVTGLDTGYFADCLLTPELATVPSIRKDIRDLEPADVAEFDAIIHLAALSNDPIGNLNERWTAEINHESSHRLAALAKAAGTPRFLFSSSCIMYGLSELELVDESSPLDPKTEYARSKVRAEAAIAELTDESFAPTFLRNGTVYGLSPRMRFDTVFNNLVGAALATGVVTVFSDGKPWRPVIHVRDVCRAFITILEAPLSLVRGEAFNVGAAHLNYQVRDLAEIAAAEVPGSQLQVLAQVGADQRTYKTDFSKFAGAFPEFVFEWDPRTGARELSAAMRAAGVTREVFHDSRFTRLQWLRHLLDDGKLDDALRWQPVRSHEPVGNHG
jgi:nucleoside-diphosphate-sugar epimerase